VQQGVRKIAEDLCTRQLGYRTMLDAAEADRREISEKRFTSLDRTILRDVRSTPVGNAFFTVVKNPTRTDLGDMARLKEQHIAARMAVLERMGLAEPGGPNTWKVRRDFETVLRAMQQASGAVHEARQRISLANARKSPAGVGSLRYQRYLCGRIPHRIHHLWMGPAHSHGGPHVSRTYSRRGDSVYQAQ
jgi:type IV secretory pathway VirD2 relaxase